MKYKTCNNCSIEKPITSFYSKKRGKYGVEAICKKCLLEKQKDKYHSKEGVAYQIYKSQQLSCDQRGDTRPVYTSKDLRDWLFSQELFYRLYHLWEISNYDTYLKPSVDRISDYESYIFSNIQLMTWGENMRKNDRDRKEGVNTKNSKAVLCLDKQTGNILTEYYSTREAERQTGIFSGNIVSNCKGRANSAGGFLWKYKEAA